MYPAKGPAILVAEDEPAARDQFETVLRRCGYSVDLAGGGEDVLARLHSSRGGIAAVVLNLVLPRCSGLDILREIRAMDARLPVIVVAGTVSTAVAVAAMKCGATDFLGKPLADEELEDALGRALEAVQQEGAARGPSAAAGSDVFLGVSAEMRELHGMAAEVGWSEAPVLIQGETGSGKEVLARELHNRSPRALKPFLKLNCAALPSELVESELFGYERGSFTGAFQRKPGMFEMADGGTILLDEIGDMEVRLQAKLLHVLQDREFQRIGGKEPIKVDVRVISATHRDLETAISEGEFREDLYYRLNVVSLYVPPLRERQADIVPLAEFLLRKHAVKGKEVPSIPGELRMALMSYHWPGNVRELENTMRKLLILRDPRVIVRDLNARMRRRKTAPETEVVTRMAPAKPAEGRAALEAVTRANQQAEMEVVLAALHSSRWNRRQAAELLGLEYKALLYKMKKFGIDRRSDLTNGVSEPQMEDAITMHGD